MRGRLLDRTTHPLVTGPDTVLAAFLTVGATPSHTQGNVRVTAKIVPEHTILTARRGKDNRGLWRIGRQDIEYYVSEAYRRTAERIAAGELMDDGEQDAE